MTVWYSDALNGNDSNAGLGFYRLSYTNGSGTQPVLNEVVTDVGGATLTITAVTVTGGSWAGGDAVGKLYGFGLTGTWGSVSGSGTHGETFTPGGDQASGAFKAVNAAPWSAAAQPGDEMRFAKSPDPVDIGMAQWNARSRVVTLDTPLTITIDNCETTWTAMTGCITTINATPTAAGSGYTLNDILTITTGGSLGQVKVTGVGGSGNVTSLQLFASGSGYTTGTGKVTSGGTGAGCTVNITAIGNATVSRGINSQKQGTYYMQVGQTNGAAINYKMAYFATGLLDLHAYQGITLWIFPSAQFLNAGSWKICLCSDVAGSTIVDTFQLVVPTTNQKWSPVNLWKLGGGNLGDAIQSIAVYADTTAPANNSNIQIDNISAITTNGLSLFSVISKNSLAQGGTENWFALQSIDGVNLAVDNALTTAVGGEKGYAGTTERVQTYRRECFIFSSGSTSSAIRTTVNTPGTAFAGYTYNGGIDPVTNQQNGESLYMNTNTNGSGINVNSLYTTVNWFGFFRFNYGVQVSNHYVSFGFVRTNNCFSGGFYINNNTVHDVLVDYIMADNNAATGIWTQGLRARLNHVWANSNTQNGNGLYLNGPSTYVGTVHHTDNNSGGGIIIGQYFTSFIDVIETANYNQGGIQVGGFHCFINKILECNNNTNASSNGLVFSGWENIIGYVSLNNNLGNAIAASNTANRNTVLSGNASGNAKSTIAYFASQELYINNFASSDTTFFPTWLTNQNGGILHLTNVSWPTPATVYNGLYTEDGSVIFNNSIKHNNQISWQFVIGVSRTYFFPLTLPLVKMACEANHEVTFSAWMKKDNASSVLGQIICKQAQLPGLTIDQIDVKANDLNWEQLTIHFTPTIAGVVEIWAQAWTLTGVAGNVWISDISVSQGN